MSRSGLETLHDGLPLFAGRRARAGQRQTDADKNIASGLRHGAGTEAGQEECDQG